MWTLAHIGIVGNEWTDRLTKEAIKKVDVDIQIPLSKSEGTSIVWKESKNLWKMPWDNEVKGRHSYRVQNTVEVTRNRGINRQEIIISRIRTGHCCLNGTLFRLGKPTETNCPFDLPLITHHYVNCDRFNYKNLHTETKNRLILSFRFKANLLDTLPQVQKHTSRKKKHLDEKYQWKVSE